MKLRALILSAEIPRVFPLFESGSDRTDVLNASVLYSIMRPMSRM